MTRAKIVRLKLKFIKLKVRPYYDKSTNHNFELHNVQEQIPLYADPTKYPEDEVQIYWNTATFYVTNIGNCGTVQGNNDSTPLT